MLVCSCCLVSGHTLDEVWVSEKIKVPSHTGLRSSVAVQLGCTGRAAELFTITLELNSGPALVMSTRSLLVNGSAEAGLLHWKVKCSGCISSLLIVHRNWCDLTPPAWWPHRQPCSHRSSYVQNHKSKCRQYKLWLHMGSKPPRVISTLEMPSSTDCAKEIKIEYF